MKDALIATAKGYCLMECMDFVKIVGRGGWMKDDWRWRNSELLATRKERKEFRGLWG